MLSDFIKLRQLTILPFLMRKKNTKNLVKLNHNI